MGEKTDHLLKISELIFRKIKGDITSEEEILLKEWIDRSTLNMTLFNSFFNDEEFSRRQKKLNVIDINRAWDNVNAKITAETQNKRTILFSTVFKYAAVIIVVVSISFSIILLTNSKNSKTVKSFVAQSDTIRPGSWQALLHVSEGNTILLGEKDTTIIENGIRIENTKKEISFRSDLTDGIKEKEKRVINYRLETPVGGEYQVVLSDGSRVWLNAASELSYPSDFIGDKRVVELKGEAYFEIQPDKNKAFVVMTNKMDVRVTGTTFNISVYEDDDDMHATLVEGTVDISVKGENGNTREYIMNPGMQVLVDEKNPLGECNYVDVSKYTAWRNGFFVFEDDPLEEILRKISRWYSVDFIFIDPDLKGVSFTADIKRFESFSTILDLISLGSDVHFDVSGNKTIYVTNSKNK